MKEDPIVFDNRLSGVPKVVISLYLARVLDDSLDERTTR